MTIIKKSPGIILIEQYGNKYIRYDAGHISDVLVQIKINEDEFDRVQKEEITMESVVNYYDNRGLCSDDKLRNSLIKDYLRTVSNYSEKRLSSIITKLIAHKDIYFEFYDFVLYEQFPEDAIVVEGLSAQHLATNYHLSPLGAYNYLIYLREMPEKALADLKAGLPTKDLSKIESKKRRTTMKQQEFLQLIDQYGINLNKLSITIGRVRGWEGAHGIYEKNGTWFYYSADGRNHIYERPIDSEDKAFDKLLIHVFMDLCAKRYITKTVDEEIVKIGKEKICSFIQETYSMSEQQANDAWAYLKQDMHVLFEFKHYVAKGSFVPDKYCYKVKGYSAEQLHTTTHLNVLEAFNYLVYLRLNPKEALNNLEKELTKRKNSSNKALDEIQKTIDEKSVARATSTFSEKMSESKKPITKKQEFFQAIDDYGIDLTELSIVIGECCGWEGAHGIYEKNGTWFDYSADERNHIYEDPIGSEDEAFDQMLIHVFVDLDTKCYLTKSIDEDIVKIKKEKICRFIQETYSMSEQQANDAWAYLKQDMHVLFEFKYYVAKGSFVPDKYCYKVKGYSAEQLHTTAHLDVLEAFNYLVYLRLNPKEALDNLEKALFTRIKNSSDKVLDEVPKTMDEKNTSLIAGAEQITEVLNDANVSQSELLTKLNAVQKALTGLQQTFDDKISEDMLKNGLFGNMHSELVYYQKRALDDIVDMIALDINHIVDVTKNHVRVYNKKDPTEENYKELISVVNDIAKDLDDILYRRLNIKSYRVPGHKVDGRRQKIIQTVPTDNKSRDTLIAFRVTDGYEKYGNVFRLERIKTFKYEASPETPSKN